MSGSRSPSRCPRVFCALHPGDGSPLPFWPWLWGWPPGVLCAHALDLLLQNGLESSQLIVGVDFTKSNTWQGEKTFGGRCLHAIGAAPNPYEVALSAIAATLEPFDDDHLIPVFGFGDLSTQGRLSAAPHDAGPCFVTRLQLLLADRNVFSFFDGHRPCQGLNEALWRYRSIAPVIMDKMSGGLGGVEQPICRLTPPIRSRVKPPRTS